MTTGQGCCGERKEGLGRGEVVAETGIGSDAKWLGTFANNKRS